MTVFKEYAEYYDLLYQDKDYTSEARYVTDLFEILKSVDSFQGLVEASASEALSAVAVKEHGAMLTTFPVVKLD